MADIIQMVLWDYITGQKHKQLHENIHWLIRSKTSDENHWY